MKKRVNKKYAACTLAGILAGALTGFIIARGTPNTLLFFVESLIVTAAFSWVCLDALGVTDFGWD